MGIRNPKRSPGTKSRGERRGEIAKKFRELRGNLKRECALMGARRLPFYGNGTKCSGCNGTCRPCDGRHEETRAGKRESVTAVCYGTHDAGSCHGDAERVDGLAEAGGSPGERDDSKGRKRKQGQGIAHGRGRTRKTWNVRQTRRLDEVEQSVSSTSRSGSSEKTFACWSSARAKQTRSTRSRKFITRTATSKTETGQMPGENW